MAIYRILMALLAPLLLARALWRGESGADLAERLGHGAVPCDLWLHGASLGELTSARWLMAALQADRPGLTVLVTANTLTGRQRVRDWQMPGVTARLAPLDLRGVLRRFLRASRPKALLSLEAEYWPLRFVTCANRQIPVLLLGARMSARSFRRWQSRRVIAATMLGAVRLASAQDAASRQHLLQLGLPADAVLPDLDLKAQAMAHLPAPVTPDRAARAGWLLAASTHEGEEALVLAAFVRQSRFTHLILAPRHPDRGAEIAALLQGTDYARRSQGAEPGGTRIYLADTLGEMDRWYATCGAVVIGGSFAPRGGHTPWEPARFGTAMLHGPDTRNFAAAFAALDNSQGAVPVTADTLHGALATLDGPAQDRLAAAAKAILQADGDIFAMMELIRVISSY
ncbi:MAG: 3-deoxy-D-manno-octulosonic acid transferase [Pseudorhodobacter sp.]|nr:3-deoxy-D-manno-octulosonic acid transferase [Pseudorhodobacter sp.]